MTRHSLLAAALAAAFFSGGALAQLKPSTKPGLAAPTPAATGSEAAAASPATRPADADEKEAAGKLAAQGWLILLDSRDWGRAWETSSAVFRKNVPLGDWMDGISKVRDPFGALVERTPTEATYKNTLEGQAAGDYVSVVFTSKFANREVREVLTTVREPDGKWRVTGYSAQ